MNFCLDEMICLDCEKESNDDDYEFNRCIFCREKNKLHFIYINNNNKIDGILCYSCGKYSDSPAKLGSEYI